MFCACPGSGSISIRRWVWAWQKPGPQNKYNNKSGMHFRISDILYATMAALGAPHINQLQQQTEISQTLKGASIKTALVPSKNVTQL